MCSSAAATWASSATGSLSPYASCTQPLSLGSSSLHCATRVDFPYPAGAETSTTRLRCATSRNRASRARGTASGPHRRNQYRRRCQQAPTLERRRRTSDSSDLCSGCANLRTHADEHLGPPANGRQAGGSESSRCGSSITATINRRFTGRALPGDAKLEAISGREYQPLWPMKESRRLGVAFGGWPTAESVPQEIISLWRFT